MAREFFVLAPEEKWKYAVSVGGRYPEVVASEYLREKLAAITVGQAGVQTVAERVSVLSRVSGTGTA